MTHMFSYFFSLFYIIKSVLQNYQIFFRSSKNLKLSEYYKLTYPEVESDQSPQGSLVCQFLEELPSYIE